MASVLCSYWEWRNFNTIVAQSWPCRRGSIMFIHSTRKLTKSDSYLRIIVCIRSTAAIRLQSSFSKPLGQNSTWMASFICSQLDVRPLGLKERKKSLGAKKETEKEMYMAQGFSFSNPLFTSLGVNSWRAPFQNRQPRGWEGTPAIFARNLLNYNEWHPPPPTLLYYSIPLHLGRTKGGLCIHFGQVGKADRWI